MMRRLHLGVWVCAAAGLFSCDSQVISLGAGKDIAELRPDDPFSEPQPVPDIALEGSGDDDPSLSEDRTLLYFNSRRDGGSGKEDIWFTERASTDEAWSEPAPVEALNTEHRETGISLAADGLTIYFSSDRPDGAGGLDIYVARRDRREDAFGAPKRVDGLSSEQDDLISAVVDADRVAYLARRAEDDAYALYRAERGDSEAAWPEPSALEALNSDDAESDAYPFNEGRLLVFTRAGDLWLAARAADGDGFEALGAWSSLNSDADDRDAWVAPDGRYVMFSSNRDGEYKLFEATR